MDSLNIETCPVHGGWMSAKWDANANSWAPYCSICRDGTTDDATLDSLRTALALARTDMAEARAALAARDAVVAEAVELLRSIRDNYEHDDDTGEHRPGYGGICRCCCARAFLATHTPTKAAPAAEQDPR